MTLAPGGNTEPSHWQGHWERVTQPSPGCGGGTQFIHEVTPPQDPRTSTPEHRQHVDHEVRGGGGNGGLEAGTSSSWTAVGMITVLDGAGGAEAALHTVQSPPAGLGAGLTGGTGAGAGRTAGLVLQTVVTLQGYRGETRRPAGDQQETSRRPAGD